MCAQLVGCGWSPGSFEVPLFLTGAIAADDRHGLSGFLEEFQRRYVKPVNGLLVNLPPPRQLARVGLSDYLPVGDGSPARDR